MNKEIKLPEIKMLYQFLLAPFIPLFVFIYVPLMLFSNKNNIERYVIMLLVFLVICYLALLIIILKFKKIVYSDKKITLVNRYGKDLEFIGSDILEVEYFEWLRVYIKNIDYDIENETVDGINAEISDRAGETQENLKRLIHVARYYVYPARINTRNGSKYFFVDEKTLKELEAMFNEVKSLNKKKFKYNENWNWLIFFLAISGIIWFFIYYLSNPK